MTPEAVHLQGRPDSACRLGEMRKVCNEEAVVVGVLAL